MFQTLICDEKMPDSNRLFLKLTMAFDRRAGNKHFSSSNYKKIEDRLAKRNGKRQPAWDCLYNLVVCRCSTNKIYTFPYKVLLEFVILVLSFVVIS